MSAPSGSVTGLVKIMRDNTESKVTEDRLKAAIAAAERASARAEDANRAKDEFIAVVSHELRTPLNTIRLWTRMLANEKLPAKDRADGVQMINRAAIAQQQVIDDLFDVSRIAVGQAQARAARDDARQRRQGRRRSRRTRGDRARYPAELAHRAVTSAWFAPIPAACSR